MKCIKTITDRDFELQEKPFDKPRHRYAARGLVFNNEGKIAILNKQNKNEYKLIGGGIEDEEKPREAFKREVLEEAGCEIVIDEFIGTIEELKSQDNFKQTSYVFVSHVINDLGKLNLTKKEIDEGSRLIWLTIEEAIKKIKDCENNLLPSKYESVYHTKFIVRRDYEILKYYTNKKTE